MSSISTIDHEKETNCPFLTVPLVQQFCSDPGVNVVGRAIDKEWVYQHHLQPIVGFNPYQSAIYYADNSAFAEWFGNTNGDLRTQNEGDFLVPEVLFACHDYLHIWCVAAINTIEPHLQFGYGDITPANVEKFAYCHLLTEAVATVGLDYWYLSCNDISQLLDIGTCQRTLTVSYDEDNLSEYQRFNPDLFVQDPEFLVTLARFYATGRFPGFDATSLKRSPMVLGWLKHELSYGALQRRYTRQWLEYLAAGRVYGAKEDFDQAIDVAPQWRDDLTREIAGRLWSKIKTYDSGFIPQSADPDASWKASESTPLDFRFTNANAFGPQLWGEIERRGFVVESFDSLYSQVMSRCVYEEIDDGLIESLPTIKASKSVSLLKHLISDIPQMPLSNDEQRDIFFLS